MTLRVRREPDEHATSGVTLNRKVYVADWKNDVVRSWNGTKLETAAGTRNMSGSCAGTLASARIAAPFGIATDGARLFVTTDLNTICQIDLANDSVVTLAGDPVAPSPGYSDGPGSGAHFRSTTAIAVRGTGAVATLFIADTNNRLSRTYDFAPMAVGTMAGVQGNSSGQPGPPLSAATFCVPEGAAFLNGLLYVSDTCLHTIRVLDPALPSSAVSVLAGVNYASGAADGKGVDVLFNQPRGLAAFVDPNGRASLLVADTSNHVVRVVDVANGTVTTLAGSSEHAGLKDGPRTTAARLSHPLGLATDGSAVYVADSGQGAVRVINGDSVSTITPQPATALSSPAAIAVDTGSTLYVTDLVLASVVKLVGQTATTLVGGPMDALLLDSPQGIAVDESTLYVADTGHDVIRTFTKAGQATGSLSTSALAAPRSAAPPVPGSRHRLASRSTKRPGRSTSRRETTASSLRTTWTPRRPTSWRAARSGARTASARRRASIINSVPPSTRVARRVCVAAGRL